MVSVKNVVKIIKIKDRRKRLLIKWLLLLAWMLVIFSFSGEVRNSSHARSEAIVNVVKSTLHVKASDSYLEFLTRKSAHTLAYLVLGVLVFNITSEYRFSIVKRKKQKDEGQQNVNEQSVLLLIVLSSLLCMSYAVSDEFHQLFTAGRGGLVSDVVLDTTASCVGVTGFWLVRRKRLKL
jgi:VanZ family protein